MACFHGGNVGWTSFYRAYIVQLVMCSNFHNFLILQVFYKTRISKELQSRFHWTGFIFLNSMFWKQAGDKCKSIFSLPVLAFALIWSCPHSSKSSNFFHIASWKYSCFIMELSLPPTTIQFSCQHDNVSRQNVKFITLSSLIFIQSTALTHPWNKTVIWKS